MTRVEALGGHPIEQHRSPNVGGAMSGHRGIVLHIAEGTYRGTINWQMNPDQRYGSGGTTTTSSTWIVGRDQGEWAQMADSNTIAWCQRGGSRDWNSIELAGYAPAGPTAWQVEACAQLLAWHHREYGTPLAVADNPSERGLGHHSMDREWLGEEWGHDSCPGSGVIAAKAAIVNRAKAIAAGGDDMSWDQAITLPKVDGVSYADPTKPADDTLGAIYAYVLQTRNQANAQFAAMRAELAALRGVVETLAGAVKAGGGSVDTAAILAGVDERVARVRAEVADELAARIAS